MDPVQVLAIIGIVLLGALIMKILFKIMDCITRTTVRVEYATF
jgi:hypothetical protein